MNELTRFAASDFPVELDAKTLAWQKRLDNAMLPNSVIKPMRIVRISRYGRS